MKLILFGLVVLAINCQASLFFPTLGNAKDDGLSTTKKEVKSVREAIYTQWVDHANRGATFDQVIYIRDEFYRPGGPVLIFISMEIQIQPGNNIYDWVDQSHMVNIAKELGGIIYAPETRYFGRSYPTTNLSLENLQQFLSINQIMGDYVSFITFLRQELVNFDLEKFVLIGFDRGGTMATWIHQRYPNLVDGIWAISAPINIPLDFGDYYYHMRLTLKYEFPDWCQKTIIEAFDELDSAIEKRDMDHLRYYLPITGMNDFDLSKPHDVALLYIHMLASIFTNVEYGSTFTIKSMCDSLYPSDRFSGFAILGGYLGMTRFPYNEFNYTIYISNLQKYTLDATMVKSHDRQLLYLQCTGWSFFKTSIGLPEPHNRRFPIEFFRDVCNDVFGISFSDLIVNNERINSENAINLDLQNGYFTKADLDPYSLLTMQEDLNNSTFVGRVPYRGKLYDFFIYLDTWISYYELEAVRDRAVDLVRDWTWPNVLD